MLSTSTHDTKLSEDARARLLALSELPERWADFLREWREANRASRRAWASAWRPMRTRNICSTKSCSPPGRCARRRSTPLFRERIRNYMRKALAESKANTNWASPNEPWMKAHRRFHRRPARPGAAGHLLADVHRRSRPTSRQRGALFSLVQVALKLTSPGVPDIYQGCEICGT
jgi:(1->4)-alpha-D-glucan 1-alpha-D-glucosylmutase